MTTRNYNKRNFARRRIQRTFHLWFAEYRHQFTVPVRIGKRTHDHIDIEFIGSKGFISASLQSWDISVAFHWKEICWDFFICFEVMPELSPDGYICLWCESCDPEFCGPKKRKVYAHREDLWREHLFGPFLDWVNNTLATSPWIEIMGEGGGFTMARLLKSLPKPQHPDADGYKIIANPCYIGIGHNG